APQTPSHRQEHAIMDRRRWLKSTLLGSGALGLPWLANGVLEADDKPAAIAEESARDAPLADHRRQNDSHRAGQHPPGGRESAHERAGAIWSRLRHLHPARPRG